MIELIDVRKRLGARQILDGMTLRVPKGVNYVLMGPSGTGKSVTLKHVIGILRPDSGSVRVDGMEVPTMDHKQLMALRKRMGYLFQNGALINWLTVFDNVALPLREHVKMAKGEVDYDAAAAQKAADNLLSAVTIDTSMLWPAGSDSAADPTSTALPDLWAEGAEVAPKGKAMVEAATAMQAEAGKGLDNLKAAMGAVGAACGGCHKAFRKPN